MKEKYFTLCLGCSVICYFTSKRKEEKRKKTCPYCLPYKPNNKKKKEGKNEIF
jgi:hypothetical protein